MKIVRFLEGDSVRYGIQNKGMIQAIDGDPYGGIKLTDHNVEISTAMLLAPCVPTKIVAIGINYRSHALEFGHEIPPTPLMFLKPPSAVIGPGSEIVYPDMSGHVDYEGEVGVVIGHHQFAFNLQNLDIRSFGHQGRQLLAHNCGWVQVARGTPVIC